MKDNKYNQMQQTFGSTFIIGTVQQQTNIGHVDKLIISTNGAECEQYEDGAVDADVVEEGNKKTSFDDKLKEIAKQLKGHRTLKWSDVYWTLHEKCVIGVMTARDFGIYIQQHTGVSVETVRKSGDFTKQPNTNNRSVEEIKRMLDL